MSTGVLTSQAITSSCLLPLLPLTLVGAVFGTVDKNGWRVKRIGEQFPYRMDIS
jgi:hypothetical protein